MSVFPTFETLLRQQVGDCICLSGNSPLHIRALSFAQQVMLNLELLSLFKVHCPPPLNEFRTLYFTANYYKLGFLDRIQSKLSNTKHKKNDFD